jgi:UDP-N-acetylmuramoylalanine-D-glutamate ligase
MTMEEASKIDEPVYLLFSPGATSFAQFRNEFDRGEKFNAIVSDIMSK